VHLVIEHATGVANTTIPVQTWEAALQNPNPTCVARIAIGNIWAYAAGATPERYESKAENLWPSSFHVSVADPAVTEDDLLLLRYAPKPEPARFDRYETVDIWADGECIEVPVERFTEIEHSARGTISKIGNSGRRALWRVDEAYYWDADGRLSAEEVELTLWDAKRRREARFDRLRKIRARDEDADSYRRERIPDDVRSAVWARDEGRCVRCGAAEDLQFDHIIPVSRGGNASIDNIQILCGNCNRQKGNSIV
jgi:5-methylcytosine-specific restriction endonuclease McrA